MNLITYIWIHYIHQQKGSTFSCVSSVPIPYPLSSELQHLYDEHKSGKWEFSVRLFPMYDDSLKCEHGDKFTSRKFFKEVIFRKTLLLPTMNWRM